MFFIIICFPILVFSQQFDVRKSKWGMTINEIKLSEKPLHPTSENSNELRYEKVDLNGTMSATILYTFSNGKLIEVRYLVYGPEGFNARGTCEKLIPLSNKMILTKFIYDALIEKNMQPYSWQLEFNNTSTDPKLKQGKYDSETIKILESEVKRLKSEEISLYLSNQRSSSSIRILTTLREYSVFFKCNDDYYNTYMWLIFTPTTQVLDEIRKSTF